MEDKSSISKITKSINNDYIEDSKSHNHESIVLDKSTNQIQK